MDGFTLYFCHFFAFFISRFYEPYLYETYGTYESYKPLLDCLGYIYKTLTIVSIVIPVTALLLYKRGNRYHNTFIQASFFLCLPVLYLISNLVCAIIRVRKPIDKNLFFYTIALIPLILIIITKSYYCITATLFFDIMYVSSIILSSVSLYFILKSYRS